MVSLYGINHFLWFLVGTIHISVLTRNHLVSHLLHSQNNFRNGCCFYVVSGFSFCPPTYPSRHMLNVPRETKILSELIQQAVVDMLQYAALTLLWGVLWVSGQRNVQFPGEKLQFSAFWVGWFIFLCIISCSILAACKQIEAVTLGGGNLPICLSLNSKSQNTTI